MDEFFKLDSRRPDPATDVEWLNEKTSLDFNGIIISEDEVCIYMDMQPYIAKSLALFGMTWNI